MITPVVTARRRPRGAENPVELRFVDMLLIIIATLMFVAIVLSVISAFEGNGSSTVVPRITTAAAPAAIDNQAYALTLAVEGGNSPYTWQVVSGDLPDGLSLDANGTIHGTPAVSLQSTQVGLRVIDGTGRSSAVRELALTVRPSGQGANVAVPLRIISPTILLTGAVAGRQYSYDFKTDSGTPPDRWTGSTLPAGLQLTPDGTLTGSPQNAGTSTFTVTLTDSTGATAKEKVQFQVQGAPESWFWRVLGWLRNAVTFYGYFLVAVGVWFWLFGHPGSNPAPGVIRSWRRRV